MERVAVIGTGVIGSPIARCIIRAGYPTTVYDVRREAMEPLIALGARGAHSLSECAANQFIVIVVANDAQVEDVISAVLKDLGDARPLIAVMSTVSPATVRALGRQCRLKGVGLIDAPVSGGHVAAERGDLTIMAGGPTDIFETMRPVLSVIGTRIYHLGELGAGEVVKLTNNMIGVTNMFLTMEALAAGVRNGVSLDTLLSVIDVSSGSNSYIRNWPTSKLFFSDFARDMESAQSNLSLSKKDLTHARELAESFGRASPLLAHIIKALEEMEPQYVVDQWHSVLSAQTVKDGEVSK